MKEKVIEVDTTPRWEDLMPRYFQILARKPVVNAYQELLDLVKAECMRAAILMDQAYEEETGMEGSTFEPPELTSACGADQVV